MVVVVVLSSVDNCSMLVVSNVVCCALVGFGFVVVCCFDCRDRQVRRSRESFNDVLRSIVDDSYPNKVKSMKTQPRDQISASQKISTYDMVHCLHHSKLAEPVMYELL
jgi:hypothetical protein